MVGYGDVNNRGKGMIFNVQRFSLHDGPGIRTLVFMKGCPLRCLWCSNPESQNDCPEIAFKEAQCIGSVECGRCKEICPVGAITEDELGKIKIDRGVCTNCGKCAKACPAQAISLFGECTSIGDIIKIVEEDSSFSSRSGGGITVSGGEPLYQSGFLLELLKKCQGRGIHTAIETTGYADIKDLEKVWPNLNLVLYDIKQMDSAKHKRFTEVGNELILENIRKISHTFPKTPIIARTTVVPGFNDSEEDINKIADFLREIKTLQKYELLPYHRFGQPKYQHLGRRYSLAHLQPPGGKCMEMLKGIAQKLP